MDPVATYFDAQSLELAEGALRTLGIPYTLQRDQGDMEATEILVEPEHYDRACEVVEQLHEFMIEQATHKRKARPCPKCREGELQLCEDFAPEQSLTGITAMFRCPACGYLRAE